MFTVSDTWKTTYPEATAGVLVIHNVSNPIHNTELDKCKEELERELRSRYGDIERSSLKKTEPLTAYERYFKRFSKTYHLQHQLESIVLKGNLIPRIAALVESMFMAELKNLLLTAGHDLDKLRLPIALDIARGGEKYICLNGEKQVLKSGDMRIADKVGIISSILFGPDNRTKITHGTKHVLFTVYGVPGIDCEKIYRHLKDIEAYILVIAPEAEVKLLEVYSTSQIYKPI